MAQNTALVQQLNKLTADLDALHNEYSNQIQYAATHDSLANAWANASPPNGDKAAEEIQLRDNANAQAKAILVEIGLKEGQIDTVTKAINNDPEAKQELESQQFQQQIIKVSVYTFLGIVVIVVIVVLIKKFSK